MSDIELGGSIPRLPDHYNYRRMFDMFPDEIAHLYPNALKADKATGYLFIDRENTLEKDCAAPSFYGNRTGVMRLYSLIGEQLVDGFIADLRYVDRGAISTYVITSPEPTEETDELAKNTAAESVKNPKYEPLLAAIVLDVEGEEQFIGDPTMFPNLERLKDAVEEVRRKRDSDGSDEEETIETFIQPSLFDDLVEVESTS